MGQPRWAGSALCSYGAAGVAISGSPRRRPRFSKRPYVFAWWQPDATSRPAGRGPQCRVTNAQLKALGLDAYPNSIGGPGVTRRHWTHADRTGKYFANA